MRKSVVSLGVIAIAAAACGGFGSDDDEETPAPPPVVDNSKPPEQVDGKPIPGIYVSSSKGREGATGFPGSPLKTLKEGMARAKAENLRLIVCAEEYAENVELIDGVSAYGYYDCGVEPWARIQKRAVVRAPSSPALLARDIKAATRIEGFEIVAPDRDTQTAAGRDGSSIAVEARNIPANTFFLSDVVLRGGRGAAGADGTPAAAPTPSGSPQGIVGFDQNFASCPNPAIMNCTNPRVTPVEGPSITCGAEPAPGKGGDGGDGMWLLNGAPSPNSNTNLGGKPVGAPGTIASQFGTECGNLPSQSCAAGYKGGDGAAGRHGANGSWSFDAEGFVLGDGTQGASGEPGKGGQGGGSAYIWFQGAGNPYGAPPDNIIWARTARGGTGGSGGCGGLAGGAGGGGGASIGLLALDAAVSIERAIVESSRGGRAGRGTVGSAGQNGGGGGLGGQGAGSGGAGGNGGKGGTSGNGAPGPSIALAFRGVRPVTAAGVVLQPGTGGEAAPAVGAGNGDVPGTGAGVTLNEYAIKP